MTTVTDAGSYTRRWRRVAPGDPISEQFSPVVAGAAIGGGIGALVDKARSRRVTQVIYRASDAEPLFP
jgi:hypothetical protein